MHRKQDSASSIHSKKKGFFLTNVDRLDELIKRRPNFIQDKRSINICGLEDDCDFQSEDLREHDERLREQALRIIQNTHSCETITSGFSSEKKYLIEEEEFKRPVRIPN
jgi:hypothetical protein